MESQIPVATVKAQESEDLAGLPLQSPDQELARDVRLVQAFSSLHGRLGKPLPEFECCRNRRGFGRADACLSEQLWWTEAGESRQPAALDEQSV
jgi:hypothetical protein